MSLVAGLIAPDAGSVSLKGKPVTGPGPDRGLVFQSYSLMPWLTVAGNVALAVDAVFTRESKAERTARTRRSEEHTSELQSLMRISYAVFCLQKKNKTE